MESLFSILDQRASDIISHRLATAVDRANGFYESESSRLIYLRTINPGITEQELDALAFAFKPLESLEGDTIIEQGHQAAALHLLVAGELKVSKKRPDGREVLVAVRGLRAERAQSRAQ